MDIIYREILAEDNKELAHLIRSVLKEFGQDKDGTVYTDPTTDNLFQLFQEKNSCYLIAEINGVIIGGCGIFPTKGLPNSCVELVKLYLLKDYRKLGIGKKLLEMLILKAKDFQFKQIYLESIPELKAAVTLYEKLGFKHITERLGESGHFACDILMLKDL